jgi:hypothetical protein
MMSSMPTTQSSVVIVDPCGDIGTIGRTINPPLASLAGRRIGVLDNGKPNALLLMTEMARLLAARAGATVGAIVSKRTAAEPCEEPTLATVLDGADVILSGSADCGSCTSWSIFDVDQVERAGKVSIGITTTAFEGLSRQVASTLGLPSARICAVGHPLGGIDDDAVRALAANAVEDLLRLATTR